MSDLLDNSLDLMTRYQTGAVDNSTSTTSWRDGDQTSGAELSFTDMLQLMIVQFQNQTIDNQASTADMMNQLVQMTVMQAITDMNTQIEAMTEASNMSYAASLVGKEVTIGIRNEYGLYDEMVGTVTGTGVLDGEHVIVVNGEYYYLNEILAIGRLPEMPTLPDTETGEGEGSGGSEDVADPTEGANYNGTGAPMEI